MNRVSSSAILEGLADDGVAPAITVLDHSGELGALAASPRLAGWSGSRNRQNRCWTRSGVSNRQ